MTSLPDISEALCLAIARGEQDRVKALALQVAAKLSDRTPERASRIQRAFEFAEQKQQPVKSLAPLLYATNHKHWTSVSPISRRPWLPPGVREQLDQWSLEQQHAEVLTRLGEALKPLLLVGETGCGKTSTALSLAIATNISKTESEIEATATYRPIYRLSLGGLVAQWQGESGRTIQQTFSEITPGALWLVDEIDAFSGSRTSESSAAKDQAHAIGCLLTSLDNLSPHVSLVATSNMRKTMDAAVLRRFTVITWPTWDELDIEQATSFFISHGGAKESLEIYFPSSYDEAISIARQQRINKILNKE